MRMITKSLFPLGAVVFLLSIAVVGETIVDTTGPHNGSDPRNAAKFGHGEGVGRKLPLQVAMEIRGTPSNADGRTVVEFILTNASKNDITLPISPNPGDVESTASFTTLSLYMTSDKRHEAKLQSGANAHNPYIVLYGSHAIQSTLATLGPGESIRVRADVGLPHVSGAGQTDLVFVAHVMLNDEIIKTVGGHPVWDSFMVGFASSPEYTPQSLFKSPD